VFGPAPVWRTGAIASLVAIALGRVRARQGDAPVAAADALPATAAEPESVHES
jgi:hypothetical protein